jgi:multiple sugar transport system substrate-binding protein
MRAQPDALDRAFGHRLSRRALLARAAVLAASGLAAGACSYVAPGFGVQGRTARTLTYWNLLGGGDGVRMQTMQAAYAEANPTVDLQAVTLTWGNPYYTKLSMATVGGSPPDVAIAHLTRLPALAPAGLLQPLEPADLSRHGMRPEDFVATAWEQAQHDGRLYAIPLDTHPFVLYYNTDVAKKAGLLGGDGALAPLTDPDALVDALERAKRATGAWGLSFSSTNDFATPWRLFYTLYNQLGGRILDQRGEVVLDDAKAEQALTLMRRLTVEAQVAPPDMDYGGAVALFASGEAGFFFQGDWELPTFQTAKLPFDMQPFPTLFGRAATQADSHALVLPRTDPPDPERTDLALGFVRSLLDQSLTWVEGGHIPSWLPVQRSEQYRRLEPQANYAGVADEVVYDPPAWFSGSGSTLEVEAGGAFQAVMGGRRTPAEGVARFRAALDRIRAQPSPI